jgi:hypothetical protein
VPIIIGVIVLGFIIGAGLSVAQRHGEGDTVALATSSPFGPSNARRNSPLPTPIPASRRGPVAFATARAEPTETSTASPRPSPNASAEASHAPQPQRTKIALVTNEQASPSATPAPQATPPPAASDEPTAGPPIHRTAAATAEPEATLAPAAAPASVVPTAISTPGTVLDANNDFSRLAGNVVRQYLLALARGDTDSAYAALGNSPGSHPASVPEAAALDATMHIGRITAVGSDTSATVNVELTTASGAYSGQYTVHKSATGAAVIVAHTFGKP